MSDELTSELRALGRSAVVPPVAEGLATAVLEAIADEPVRRSLADVLRSRWRALLALLAVLLAGTVVVSPVRATVAEWLNIGGVEAQPVGQAPSATPTVPPVTGQLGLQDAARVAGFTPAVPRALGAPTGVEASYGFVAMSWASGERLEQFLAEPAPKYIKKYYMTLEVVDSVNGFWFNSPYELVLVDKASKEKTIRVAGPTLVWVLDSRTFRLEGVADEAQATEIALSATP
ncbi:hypothetical protein F1D05_36580 [Kribbella qitaiheensis]|uniref:DUF4367 domain-containing protein n=1 Tax=Kribbella qitaiheensis TaxID=1544730 RepID=A0A7G6X845_9ACTN|nr:hypothetical protein [Kribbella qitaiheensis]QNE22410.1 hypothetical protein F1D05_36580 [Kribbella qitaiheensis]